MHKYSAVLIALGLVVVALASTSRVSSEEAGAPWSHEVGKAFHYEDWPKTEGVFRGFQFDLTDYEALSGFTAASDEQKAIFMQVPANPILAVWHGGDEPYKFTVQRKLKLVRESGGYIELTIEVAPTVGEAHRRVLLPWNGAGDLPREYKLASAHGVQLADVCILRDGPIETGDGWDGNTSTSYFFFRNNVMVDVKGSDAGTNLIELAIALDAKIEEQHAAADGNPQRPEVSIELGTNLLKLKPLRPNFGTVDVEYSATWRGQTDSVKLRPFSTEKTANYRSVDDADDEDGMEPDPDNPTTFVEGSQSFNLPAPSKIDQITNGCHGKHHIGLVGWGPNLVPKVAYAELEVDSLSD